MITPAMLLETAPAFVAQTAQGVIKFPDEYEGKWVILFSHPADFTPVCITEFKTFALMKPEFTALNCELVGLSTDSNEAHIAWLRIIREKDQSKNEEQVGMTFPLIANVKVEVADAYDMVQPTARDTQVVRAVYLIDPMAIVRAVLYYPLSNGRNFPEIKRLLIALQITDAHGCVTPTEWRPGDDVIVLPGGRWAPCPAIANARAACSPGATAVSIAGSGSSASLV